jgi:flavin-dependent dehydrogenase
VVVVGGGPAGVAAAVALRQRLPRRSHVLLLDAARFPRDKPCGGALTGRALAALAPLGLHLRVPAVWIDEAELWAAGGRRRVKLPRPVAVVCRRELDADLLMQARERGVEVLEGTRVFELQTGGGPPDRLPGPDAEVVVSTGSGAVRTRLVVGADGAAGLCRRHLLGSPTVGGGSPGPAPGPPAMRLVHVIQPLPSSSDTPDMVYDLRPAQADHLSGYAWWFRSPRGINLGAMHVPSLALGADAAASVRLQARDHQAKGERLRACARALGLPLCTLDPGPLPFHGWPAPAFQPGLPLAGDGLVLAGDAAGIDPLTGEGISFALEDGPLVAETALRHLDSDRQALAGHAARRRRSPGGRTLAARHLLARLLYRWPTWTVPLAQQPAVLALLADEISGNRPLVDAKPAAVLAAMGAALSGTLRAAIRGPRRSAPPTHPRHHLPR